MGLPRSTTPWLCYPFSGSSGGGIGDKQGSVLLNLMGVGLKQLPFIHSFVFVLLILWLPLFWVIKDESIGQPHKRLWYSVERANIDQIQYHSIWKFKFLKLPYELDMYNFNYNIYNLTLTMYDYSLSFLI